MSGVLTSRQLKLSLKLRVLKCYIMSIFTYGCEAWTLTEALENRIQAFEMWCLRRIGGISWKDKVTNESVLQRMGTERNLLKSIKPETAEILRAHQEAGWILVPGTRGKA